MPDTAQQSANPAITYTDDHLKGVQQKVAQNLNEAGVKTPYQAVKPIHVPEERAKNIVDQTQVDAERSIPGSFKSTPETALSPLKALSEHLDYADQIVTGRTHVIDEASRFAAHKDEKEQKRMQYANSPKTDSRTPVKKFVDWLHD
jgi:hypothetical protein